MSGTVAILLALHQSQGFLADLLTSLSGQTYEDWTLHASLDGSDDGSAALIQAFAARQSQRVAVQRGPGLGFAANFLGLLSRVEPEAEFGAFCDHDDVWLPDKLDRAVRLLSQASASVPALYASRMMVCDKRLRPIALSPHPDLGMGFRGALSRSIASGNTMVLNRAGIELMQEAIEDGENPAFHDWWTYQLVTGAGGRVIFDPAPTLLYRQHSQNVLGSSVTWQGKARRLWAILNGDHRRWTRAQIDALWASRHRLLPENRQTLDALRGRRAGPRALWPEAAARSTTEK